MKVQRLMYKRGLVMTTAQVCASLVLLTCSHDLGSVAGRPCKSSNQCSTSYSCVKGRCQLVDAGRDVPAADQPPSLDRDTRKDRSIGPDKSIAIDKTAPPDEAAADSRLPDAASDAKTAPPPDSVSLDVGQDANTSPPPDSAIPDVGGDAKVSDASQPDLSPCVPGAACDDKDSCTFDDTCDTAGKCKGKPCALTQCMWTAACSSPCSFKFKTKGGACDDKNSCTVGDMCNGKGSCVGTFCPQPAPVCFGSKQLQTVTKTACKAGKCDYTYAYTSCPGAWQACKGAKCVPCDWTAGSLTVSNNLYKSRTSGFSIALDLAGKVHGAFVNGGQLNYLTNAGGAWTTKGVVGASVLSLASTSTAVDSGGTVHIALSNLGALKYLTGNKQWTVKALESGSTRYASMALDAQGKAHIAYRDDTSPGNLKYATNAAGSWTKQFVDSGGKGQYASIAVDAASKAHISYYDDKYKLLKYATNASGGWVKTPVPWPPNKDYGLHTSLDLDSKGKAHIALVSMDPKYFVGYATNKSGAWKVVQVTKSTAAPRSLSLSLDTKGFPHLTYNTGSAKLGLLTYATNISGVWRTQPIPKAGHENQQMTVGAAGMIHQLGYRQDPGTFGTKYTLYSSFVAACP